jgi:hypothetical protein
VRTAVQVCVPGYGHYWLWLVTYETRAELYAAAKTYSGHTMSDDEEVEACFSSNQLKTNYLGIMRLYDLSTETIIHESVHAAACLANKNHGFSRTLSQAKEEAIAYGAEAIATAVHEVIYPGEHDE